MTEPTRPHVRASSFLLTAVLLGGALACQLVFHVIGSRVDKDGKLREPFFLIPVSTVLALGGLAAGGMQIVNKTRPQR